MNRLCRYRRYISEHVETAISLHLIVQWAFYSLLRDISVNLVTFSFAHKFNIQHSIFKILLFLNQSFLFWTFLSLFQFYIIHARAHTRTHTKRKRERGRERENEEKREREKGGERKERGKERGGEGDGRGKREGGKEGKGGGRQAGRQAGKQTIIN